MATLNREIFGTENGDISTAEIDLGDWVLCNGVATKLEETVLEPGEQPELMEPHEILRNLMLQAKGDLVSIREGENYLPYREPIQLPPLDPSIIEKMTGVDFGSSDFITRELTKVVNL